MKRAVPLCMWLSQPKWLLIVVVAGWAGCSFDAGKLRGTPNQDASTTADHADGPLDGATVGADTRDVAEVPADTVVIENDTSLPSEHDTPADEPALASSDDAESRAAEPGEDVAGDLAPALEVDAEGTRDDSRVASDADGTALDVPGVADAPQDAIVADDSAADGGADERDSAMGPETGSDAPPASSCGGSGQFCCAGNVCSNNGCCANGVCVASGKTCPSPFSGICANGACGTCGGANGTCCTSSSCTAANTICQTTTFPTSTTCAACGGNGDPCCPGNLCLDGGCCIAQPTGSGTATCKAAGLACSPSITYTCSAGACGACGGLGDPCCVNSRCTAPNTLCQTAPGIGGQATCVACGGAEQPCCPNTTTGGTATCFAGLNCQTAVGPGAQSSCVACGGPGQPCCGSITGGAGTCLSGACRTGSCP